MKNFKFKGTLLFAVAVILLVAVGVYDYRKQQEKKEAELAINGLIKNKSFQDLSAVKFTGPLGSFELSKTDGVWMMQQPFQDRGDEAALDAFVTGIMGQDVAEVEVEGAVDWAKYGLLEPQAKIVLTYADGSTDTVALGTVRAFNESFYIRKNEETKLLLGSRSFSGYINKVAAELRNKQLYFGFGEFQSMELKRGGQTLRFVMDNNEWKYPADAKFPLSQQAVADLANVVRHLKADTIVSESSDAAAKQRYALTKPAFVIEVKDKNAKGELHWIGEFSEVKNGEAFVLTNQSNGIYRVPVAKVNELQVSLVDLKDRQGPFQFDNTRIAGFKIKTAGEPERLFYRQQDRWQLAVDEPHRKINQANVESFMNQIRALEVDRFLNASQIVANKNKAEGAGYFIALNAVEKPVFELRWGQEFQDNGQSFVYAWTDVAKEPFLLEKSKVDGLMQIAILESDAATTEGEKK